MENQIYKPTKNSEYVSVLVCEFAGTLILTAGLNYVQNDPYAMGAIVTILTSFYWRTSGAHFNPALTLAVGLVEPTRNNKFMLLLMLT
jgi:hypothetical protein